MKEMETGKRVAYLRVSHEQSTVELQRQAMRRWLPDYDTLTELAEQWSGRKMDGPAFLKLAEWVRNGRVAEVFVYSFDRLGRNMLKGCQFAEECLQWGTVVRSMLEPYDLRTDDGLHQFHNAMSAAEWYIKRLSANTQRGLELAKKRGSFVGGSSGRWMRQATAKKLPRIRVLLERGNSINDIAKLLEMDSRTVANIANNLDNLPPVRERVWDK